MKLKNSNLDGLLKALSGLLFIETSPVTALAIAKNIRFVNDAIQDRNQVKKSIILQFAEPGEKFGSPKIKEGGQVVFKSNEHQSQAETKIFTLLDTEVEIDLQKIKVDELMKAEKIKPAILLDLHEILIYE